MRRVTRYGVIAVAASGAMAVTMPAFADSAADGAAADSPGVLSGNTIQLPVHAPVNVCGNTVNVVGLLNPAVGNSCTNRDGAAKKDGAATSKDVARGGASAEGSGKDSPGIVSGNTIQLPVHVPVNVSGNSVNVVGVGNPATGNESVNGPGEQPPAAKPAPKPSEPRTHDPRPREEPPAYVPHGPEPTLAHTGSDQALAGVAGGTLLVLSGAVLYRRFRPQAVR